MANTDPYLTFSAQGPFTITTTNGSISWDGNVEYSTDLAEWATWNGTAIAAQSNRFNVYHIYFRGTGNTTITGGEGEYNYWELTSNVNVACFGNIENLLDYAQVAEGIHPTMQDECFLYMFFQWDKLIEAPELHATALTDSCYGYMFTECTSLTAAPELPAIVLANNCYECMFEDCTGLTTPPELPATTLANSCYEGMFYGCISLMTVPELPAITLVNRCYWRMFYGCTSLKLSTTQVGRYTTQYRIPSSGTGVTATDALADMFTGTGGTFTGTPDINTIYYVYTIPKYVDSINLRGSVKYLKHDNLANDLSTASSSSIPTVKAIRDYREFTTEQYNTIANLLNLPTTSGTISYVTPTNDVVVDIELGEKLLNVTHKNIISGVTIAEDNNDLVISSATREFLSLTDEQYNTLIGIING